MPPTAASAIRGSGFHNGVAPPVSFKRLNTLAFGSKRLRRWKWRACKGSCQSPPSVRAQNSAPTAVGTCHAPCFNRLAILTEERGGRPGNASSPHQFSPLWKPPFPDPPSKLESTKGGQTAGGTGTAAVMARLKSPRGPLSPRSRAPPPYGFPGHSAAWTPLRQAPRGGRVRLEAEGSFLTPPPPVMEALRFPSRNSPLAPYAPRRGAARWFAGRAGLRARAPPQTAEGGDPFPPRARSRRRPAIPIRP